MPYAAKWARRCRHCQQPERNPDPSRRGQPYTCMRCAKSTAPRCRECQARTYDRRRPRCVECAARWHAAVAERNAKIASRRSLAKSTRRIGPDPRRAYIRDRHTRPLDADGRVALAMICAGWL